MYTVRLQRTNVVLYTVVVQVNDELEQVSRT